MLTCTEGLGVSVPTAVPTAVDIGAGWVVLACRIGVEVSVSIVLGCRIGVEVSVSTVLATMLELTYLGQLRGLAIAPEAAKRAI